MRLSSIHRLVRVASPLAALIAAGAVAGPAAAAGTASQVVSGTTLGVMSLVATPAAFTTNFAPGNTAQSTAGTVTATDTNPGWSITVQDLASSNQGKLIAAGTGCTGSTPTLANQATVQLTPLVGTGITIPAAVTINGTAQTVASATAAPLAGMAFTTGYSIVIPSNEVMTSGCVYSMTATYTIQ